MLEWILNTLGLCDHLLWFEEHHCNDLATHIRTSPYCDKLVLLSYLHRLPILLLLTICRAFKLRL